MCISREPEERKEITTVTEVFQLESEIEDARNSIVNSFHIAENLLDEADHIHEVGHILCIV